MSFSSISNFTIIELQKLHLTYIITKTKKMAAVDSTSSGYDRIEEVRKFDESKSGVKGLSDSGITSIPKFFIHSPQTLADIKNTKSSDQTTISIPIIDLSDNNRTKLISQVKEAASTWGFFQVINHGISKSVLDSTIRAYKAFHEQPHDVKSRYYKREEHCGVMYATNNDLYRSEAASWHDQLQVNLCRQSYSTF